MNRISIEQDHILKAASELWGKSFQKGMAIEECSELILSLRHYDRDRVKITKVLEEVADVLIVCRQIVLDHMLDKDVIDEDGEQYTSEAFVHNTIEYKMSRLQDRVMTDNINGG